MYIEAYLGCHTLYNFHLPTFPYIIPNAFESQRCSDTGYPLYYLYLFIYLLHYDELQLWCAGPDGINIKTCRLLLLHSMKVNILSRKAKLMFHHIIIHPQRTGYIRHTLLRFPNAKVQETRRAIMTLTID